MYIDMYVYIHIYICRYILPSWSRWNMIFEQAAILYSFYNPYSIFFRMVVCVYIYMNVRTCTHCTHTYIYVRKAHYPRRSKYSIFEVSGSNQKPFPEWFWHQKRQIVGTSTLCLRVQVPNTRYIPSTTITIPSTEVTDSPYLGTLDPCPMAPST